MNWDCLINIKNLAEVLLHSEEVGKYSITFTIDKDYGLIGISDPIVEKIKCEE